MENHDSLNEKSVNNENLASTNENEALPEENVTPIQSEEVAPEEEAEQATESAPEEEAEQVTESAPEEEEAPAEKPTAAKGNGGFFARLFAHKAVLPIAISAICVVAVVAIVLLFGLGGNTGCDHDWIAATCSTPKTCSLCNETEGDALGHALVPHSAKNPTCLEKGHNEYVSCSRCDYTTYQEVDALSHTAGAAATCTTAQICTVCNAELAPAIGHTPGAAATCTSAQTCTVCNAELAGVTNHTPGAAATCTSAQTCTVCNTEIAPALDHTPGAAATCTSAQTCTVCHIELAPALDHTPGAEATCTAPQICTVCNAELAPAAGHQGGTATCLSKAECTVCGEEYGPEPAHAWGDPVTVDPDCDTDGSATYTCSACSATKVETLPATNHTYEAQVTLPTCVALGYTTYTCSVCGDSYVADEVDATGHSLAERTLCNEEIHCSVCDYIDYGTAHTYGDAVVSDVTCINEKHTYTCAVCGYAYDETINFNEANHDIEGVTPTETQVGCEVTKVWACKDCGAAALTETTDRHETVTVITQDATCSATGTTLTTCKRCDYSQEGTIETNDNHNWNEGVLADSIRTFTCQDCNATKSVIDASDKTNTNVSKDELASSGEVALKDANINFGNEVNEGGALAGKDVNVSAEKVGVEDVPGITPELVDKIGDNPIYNFTVKEGETFISQFSDKVTVTIPYDAGDEDIESIVIWFIADDGEIEAIEASYANGYVTFETNHFSTYTVTRMTPAERCEAWGHSYKWSSVAGTCTTDGYDRGVCIRCRDITTVITSVAPGHIYTETTTAATCTVDGSTVYTCQNCTHSYSVKIPATGHTFVMTEDSAPACGVAGYQKYDCHCGDSYEVVIPALKHQYIDTVTAPTCEARGYTTHTCSICQNTYVDNYVSPLGHNYTTSWEWNEYSVATLVLTCANDAEHVIRVDAIITEKSTVPTCAVEAVITYTAKVSYMDVLYTDVKVNENTGIFAEHTYETFEHDTDAHWSVCSVCGNATEKIAHVWNDGEVVVAPTCTTQGVAVYTCACGATKNEVVEIIPHTAGAEATCTTAQVCTVCNVELVAALGHDEVAHEAVAPTCTTAGNNAYVTCSRCDYTTYEEIAALGHDEIAHDAVAPTCTVAGNNAYVTCSRCDYTTYEEIAALGHDEIAHDAVAVTCTTAGHNAYVTCSRCDYTTYEEIAALGHDEITYSANAPTCTETGNNKYVTCSRCDYTTFEEIPAKGHTVVAATCVTPEFCSECLEEFGTALGHTIVTINAVEPTCTQVGSTEAKECSVCGLVIEAAHEIPVIPHTYDDNFDDTCNVCGYVRIADCRHENTEIIPGIEATCTTGGKTEGVKCNDCNEIIVHQTLISALGHDEITHAAKLATCTETGNREYVTCSRCDYTTYEEIAALGHVEVAHDAVAPTCTTAGHNAYVTCSRAGCDYTTYEEIAALGHDEVAHEAVAPTCTEKGNNAYVTCSRCDYTTYEEIAALGHTAGAEATCTTAQVCTVCQAELVAALGHDEVAHEAVAPTCTEKGNTAYVTCSRCDYTTYEEVAALGHTAGAEATCTTAQVCTVCQAELAAALGHTAGAEATCTTAQVCTVCNAELVAALGHDEIAHEAVAPTCTEKGNTAYVTCSRCDYTTYEEVAALGHTAGAEATCTTAQVCTVCNAELVAALGHDEVAHEAVAPTCTTAGNNAYVTCSRCDYTTYEEIAALGHDEVAHEAVAPTCTVAGNNAYVTCSRCDYTTYEEIAALGHDEVAHDAVAPTCTEKGNTAYVTCSRCDYTTFQEVAALGHNYVDGYCSVCGIDENHCDHQELHEVYVDLSEYGACEGACLLYFSCECGEVNTLKDLENMCLVPCEDFEFNNEFSEENDEEMWQLSEGDCSVCGLHISAYIHAVLQNCQVVYNAVLEPTTINGVEVVPEITFEYSMEMHNNTATEVIDLSEFGACGGDLVIEKCLECGKVIEMDDFNLECDINDDYDMNYSEDGNTVVGIIDQTCPDCGLHIFVKMEQGMDGCTGYIRGEMLITMGEETIFEFSMEQIEEDHEFEETYHMYGPTCDYIYKVIGTCTICGHVEEYYDYGHNYHETIIEFTEYGMCEGYARVSECDTCGKIESIYDMRLGCKPGEMVDESYVDENGVAHTKQTGVCTLCGATISYENWIEKTPCKTVEYVVYTASRDGEILRVIEDENAITHHSYEYTYEFANGNNCANGVTVTGHCTVCGISYGKGTFNSHNALLQYRYENECGHVFEFYACPCGYNHHYRMMGNSGSGNNGSGNNKPGYDVEDTYPVEPPIYSEPVTEEPPMYDEPVATEPSMPEGSFDYVVDGSYATMVPGSDYVVDIGTGYPEYEIVTRPGYDYGEIIVTTPGDIYEDDIEEPTPEEEKGYYICNCGLCGLSIKEMSDRIVDGCTISESYELIVKLGDEVLYEFEYENSYMSHSYTVETSADENGNTVITTVCQECGEVASQTISNAVLVQDGNKYYYDLTITPEVDATYTIYSLASSDTYVELYQLVNGELKRVAYDDDDGYNSNFMLTYELKAGETYVYRIRYYSASNSGTIPYILTSELGTCMHGYGENYAVTLAPGSTNCEDGLIGVYVCSSCGQVTRIETNVYYGHDYRSEREEITELGVCYGEVYIQYCARCNCVISCDFKLGCNMEWTEESVVDENGNVHTIITQTCLQCGALLIEDRYSEKVECTTIWYKTVTFKIGEETLIDGLVIRQSSNTEHTYVYEYEFYGESQNCEDGVYIYATCSVCGDSYQNHISWHETIELQTYDLSEFGGCKGSVVEVSTCPCGERTYVYWNNEYHTNLHSSDEEVRDELGNLIGYTKHFWCDCGFDIIVTNTEVVDGCITYNYEMYTASINGEVILDNLTIMTSQSANHKYEHEFNMNGDSCEDGYTVITTCRDCDYYYYDDKYVLYGHDNTYLVYALDPSEVGCCEHHSFEFYTCPCGYNSYSKWDTSSCSCGLSFYTENNTTNEGCIYTNSYSAVLLFGEEVLYEYTNTQTYTQHTLETVYHLNDNGTLTIESVCSVCGFSAAFESQEAVFEDHNGEYWYDIIFTPEFSGDYVFCPIKDKGKNVFVEVYRIRNGNYEQMYGTSASHMQDYLEAGYTYVYRIRYQGGTSEPGSIFYMLYASSDCHHNGAGNEVHIVLNEELGCEGGVITAYICAACGDITHFSTNYRHNNSYNYVYFEEYGGCSGSYIRFYGCTACGKIDRVNTYFYSCNYTTTSETFTDENGVVHNVITYSCENCGMVYTYDEYFVRGEDCQVSYYRAYTLVIGETIVIDNQVTLFQTYTEHDYEYTFDLHGTSCEDGYTVNGVCADCGETFSGEYSWHESFTLFTFDPAAAGCCEDHYASVRACPCGYHFDFERDTNACETCGFTVYIDMQETTENCINARTIICSISVGENELYSQSFVYQYVSHNYETNAYMREDGTLVFESVCSGCGISATTESYEVVLEEHEGQYWYDFVFTPDVSDYYIIQSMTSGDTYVELYQLVDGKYEIIDHNDDGANGNNFKLNNYLEAGVTYVYRIRFLNSGVSGSIRYMLQTTSSECSHNVTNTVRIVFDDALGCEGGVILASVCNSCGGVYNVSTSYSHNYEHTYVYFEEYGGCSGSYIRLYGCNTCGKFNNISSHFYNCSYTSNSETVTDENGVVHNVTTYSCENCGMVLTINEYAIKDENCVVRTYQAYTLVIGETVVIDNQVTIYSTSTEHAYEYEFVMHGTSCADGYTVNGVCSDCGNEFANEYSWHENFDFFALNPEAAGCCNHHYAYLNACPCGEYLDWNYDTFYCDVCGFTVNMDTQETLENCVKTITRNFTVNLGENAIYSKVFTQQYVHHTFELITHTSDDGVLMIESVCSVCGLTNSIESREAVLEDHEGQYWYDLEITPDVSAYYTIFSMIARDTYVELYRLNGGEYERISSDDSGGGNGDFRMTNYLEVGYTYVYRIRFWNRSISDNIRYALYTADSNCSHNHGTVFLRAPLNADLGCEGGVMSAYTCVSCGNLSNLSTNYSHNYEYTYVYFEEYGGCSGSYIRLYGCNTCGKINSVSTSFYSCNYTSASETITDADGVVHNVTTYSCENCGMVFTINVYSIKDENCVVRTYHAYNLVIGETVVIDNQVSLYSTSTEHTYEYDFVMNGTSCTDGYTVNGVCSDCGNEFANEYSWHENFDFFALNPEAAGCCNHHYAYLRACPCGEYCDWNYDTSYCDVCGFTVNMDTQETLENCVKTITRNFTVNLGENAVYSKVFTQQYVYHTFELSTRTDDNGVLVFENVCSVCGLTNSIESREVVLEDHEGQYWYDLEITPDVSGTYIITSMTSGDTYVELYRVVDGQYSRLSYNDDGSSNNNFKLESYLETGYTYVYRIRFLNASTSGSIRYMLCTATSDCSHNHGTVSLRAPLNADLGCEGGVLSAYACVSCGSLTSLNINYSHNYGYTYVYFEEYGGCSGSYIRLYGCNTCGRINNVNTSFYSCNYTSASETITDADGVVHNVTTYTCENCGMVYTYDEYSVKDENCVVRTYRAYNLVIGETVVIDNQVSLYNTYTEHDYEYTFDMNGTSCEDGYTAHAVCNDCGEESISEYSYHNTFALRDYNLTEYGACRGYVRLYACPCGQETRLDYSGFDNSSYNEYDEDGRTYYVYAYTCYGCEARMDITYYVERDASVCKNYYYYTVTVIVGDALVADFTYTRGETAHNYVYTGTLQEGATSCEQGVLISCVCTDCGDSYEQTYTYHYQFEREQIRLGDTGAVCPGYASIVGCACGYRTSLDLNHAQCDFGYYGTDCWIDGYLTGSVMYLNTNSYASYDASMYICAVTDPEQCAYKIRYASYWLKAENECFAYQYVTYQFGYNEETGECAYEVTYPTGRKMIWHNYTVTDVSNSDIGLSGTHYDCPDCGSYYYTEHTNRDYFYEEKVDSVNTLDYNSMTEYHYYNKRDTSSDDDGYQGSESEYRYIYRDGTENYEIRRDYYDYSYEAPFGTDSYIYHSSYSNSYGSNSKQEYKYTYYNGSRYTISYEYESGSYSSIEEYTYDFDYVAPFGYNYRAYEKHFSDSNNQNYTEAYARTTYNGYEYTLYTQRTEADGSFTRYDYTYDVAERVGEDGTSEKYLASCHVVRTYTDSNGANEVTESDDHKDYYWTVTLQPTCTQSGYESRICRICEQHFDGYELSPNDHSWISVLDIYYCTRCGMQNINGASGEVVLEDLTEQYGNGENYVVGYWNRGNVEFYYYVCIILNETGEEIVLDIEPFAVDGVNALAICIADIEAYALEAGYAADSYTTKLVFVPIGADGSFDYAITFDDIVGGVEDGYIITDDEIFVDYVSYGEYVEYTIIPNETTEWIFTSHASSDTYGYLYDAAGRQLTYNDDSGEGNNFMITYTLQAGETYVLRVRWYSSSREGYIPVSLDKGHVHIPQSVPATATCFSSGYTEGQVCQECGMTLVEQVWVSELHQIGEEGTCTICGLSHTHDYVDGICVICGSVPVFENASVYDNDGDGVNESYFFTPIIPERFAAENAVHVWAGDFIPAMSSSYVSSAIFNDIRHWYCTEGSGEFFTIKVTVAEAGIYEMAIHMRMKDSKERGTKYTVNAGTEYEYSFETSFQFATDEDAFAARENDYTMSSYMFGINVNLVAGDNYITIQQSTKSPKVQHFRDFYFVKVGDINTCEHEYVEAERQEPTCEYDGYVINVCNLCQESRTTVLPAIGHIGGGQIIVNEPTCISYGMWEEYCTTCGAMMAMGYIDSLPHTFDEGVEIQAPTCTQDGQMVYTCFTCSETWYENIPATGHTILDLVCIICGEQMPDHEHSIVDGMCEICGYIPVFENASVYDNDGDGVNESYFFTPIIPEKFAAENAVHVWAGDYIPALSSSYVSNATFNEITHWYCTEGKGEFFTIKVTVAEAGIYEMAIHLRMKDSKERGTKYTVNAGTANEYSFETSFQFATDEDAFEARENDFTMSSYMFGINVNLVAGDNYIRIQDSTKSPKGQHFRDFYFVKVADWAPNEETPVEPEDYQILTVEEAIARGITYEKNAYSEEFYIVTVTLNQQVNPNGFARANLGGDLILSVAGGYLTNESEGLIALGDTVTYRAQVGCVNSAYTTTGREARLFNVEIVDIIKAPVEA